MDDEQREQHYTKGQNAAWSSILRMCLRELGCESNDAKVAAFLIERTEAIAALRELCETSGDNDWADDLALADIISKHLGR